MVVQQITVNVHGPTVNGIKHVVKIRYPKKTIQIDPNPASIFSFLDTPITIVICNQIYGTAAMTQYTMKNTYPPLL